VERILILLESGKGQLLPDSDNSRAAVDTSFKTPPQPNIIINKMVGASKEPKILLLVNLDRQPKMQHNKCK